MGKYDILIDEMEAKLRPPTIGLKPFDAKVIPLTTGEDMLVRTATREETEMVLEGIKVLLDHQKDFYDIISRMGFFNDQDRVLARQRFDTMQKLSKIISARYEIKAANILTDEVSPETGFVVMESPITVELAAVDDLDVYRKGAFEIYIPPRVAGCRVPGWFGITGHGLSGCSQGRDMDKPLWRILQ